MATSGAMSTDNQYIKYTISIAQNSQSISWNTSSVTVSVRFYRTNTGYTTYGSGTVYCKINGTTYSASVTSSQKITNSGIVLFNKTLNIPHNADGTKTLTCSAWINHQRVTSSEQSYSQTLTTIPRTSSMSLDASSVSIGGSITFTISKASSGFRHKLFYQWAGSGWIEIASGVDTSYTWTVPETFATNIPNATSGVVTLSCNTYNGSNYIGEKHYTVTVTVPASVIPSVSISVSDATGYSAIYGGYVQSKSKIAVSLNGAGNQGSTISGYSTTANGSSYSGASFTTDEIKNSGTLSIVSSVVDSRGRTGTASKSITVLPYETPKISDISVFRSDSAGNANGSGAYLTVVFNSAVSPLNNNNTVSYTVKHKKASETAYTAATLSNYAGQYSVTDGMYTFAADTASSYDVVLTVTDAFSANESIHVGPSITKLISLKNQGTGIAFGKVAEIENGFECAFDMYDQFGTSIHNGLASYTGAETGGIDPDTTTESLILTNNKTPMGSSYFMYIHTFFHNTKSATADRSQFAIPYNRIGSTYHRYYANGVWSDWRRHVCADESEDYVVAQGTSGIWTYQKWNSGLAECWGVQSQTFAASGNNYWSFDPAVFYTTGTYATFPFTFKSVPSCTFSHINYPNMFLLTTSAAATTSKTQTMRIVKFSSFSSDYTIDIGFHAVGKWK